MATNGTLSTDYAWGSIVALVTPMNADGSINYDTLNDLIEWHIAEGTNSILVAGTTGEAPTLECDEWENLVRACLKKVENRVKVIVGTGCNSTQTTIEKTKKATKWGAFGCLCVTPYYNKPTQEGLYEHFKAIAEAEPEAKIILYNVPGRTSCDMMPQTVKRLSEIKNIVGLKEACGNMKRYQELVDICPSNFCLYSGDDHLGCEAMLKGFKGVISVVANVIPKLFSQMCTYAYHGKEKEAKCISDSIMPLCSKLFVVSNPIPVKWLLHDMKKIPEGIRLPLNSLPAENHADVRSAYKLCMSN